MKTMLLISALLTSYVLHAEILNSKLDHRHQEVIEHAVSENCMMRGVLTEVKSESEVVIPDQGIKDIFYSSTFTAIQKVDNGLTDQYLVHVKSQYSDMYDHETAQWGVYTVDKVSCEMIF
jgi:hypothetical protein